MDSRRILVGLGEVAKPGQQNIKIILIYARIGKSLVEGVTLFLGRIGRIEVVRRVVRQGRTD